MHHVLGHLWLSVQCLIQIVTGNKATRKSTSTAEVAVNWQGIPATKENVVTENGELVVLVKAILIAVTEKNC
jgi:hypothetical protein